MSSGVLQGGGAACGARALGLLTKERCRGAARRPRALGLLAMG